MSLFFKLFTFGTIICFAFFIPFQAACPANLGEVEWELLLPYMLPEDHPMKSKLDYIFRTQEVLKNEKSLKKAGFKPFGTKGHSKIKILKHKKLKNYLIKAFTDDQEDIFEWEILRRRAEGSRVIRSTIDRLNFHHFFKVPQKWIYQVARKGEKPNEKNFILLVEKLEIFDNRGNAILWRGLDFVTEEKLTALYLVLKEAGLMDSIYIDNIPFCLDEKIAFVDTDHFHQWPVHFDRLTINLANKRQIFWRHLISRDP